MKPLRFAATLAVAILIAAVGSPAARAQEKIEVPWTELGQALAGRTVSTVLPDGTVLRGRVLDVSAEQLRFQANKTSNRKLYPKGELSLARHQLTVFSYSERRGKWRVAGTAIGVASGAVPATFLCKVGGCDGNYQNSGTFRLLAAGVVGAGTAIGYLLGNEADKREVTVVVSNE